MLEKLPEIMNVGFKGNPIYADNDQDYLYVLRKKKNLETIDGKVIKPDDKEKANNLPPENPKVW